MCIKRKKRKRQIAWHISDSLFYLNNGRTVYRLGDCAASSSTIMVCPVCLVGLLFDWIMIRWAVTRNMDEQRNVSVSTYTSNYLSTLWAHWWTVTVCLNKCGFSKISGWCSDEITWNAMLWVSICWMWRLIQRPEDLLAHPLVFVVFAPRWTLMSQNVSSKSFNCFLEMFYQQKTRINAYFTQ